MVLRRPAVIATGAVLAVVVLVVAGLWVAQRGRVLPNTSLAGVDVSGMTPQEAAAALEPVATARAQDPVELTFEDQVHVVEPHTLDYAIDVDASVESALRRGRRNPFTDVVVRLTALWRERDLPLVETMEEGSDEAAIEAIADEVDRDRFSGAVEADPATLEVTVADPLGAAEVRREEAVEVLRDALRTPGAVRTPLPVDVGEPPIATADVEQVAEDLERAIAEPLVLTVDDASLTVEPSQLAELVEVVEGDDGGRLELEVSEERVEETIGGAASATFDVAPRDAAYVTSRTPPARFDVQGSGTWSPVEAPGAEVEPHRDGRSFVAATAAEQLTDAVRDAAREVELEVETTEPELTTDEAADLAPTHLIGTFTTYHAAGQVRVANIQRLADVVDDTQLLPGEQFSINELSGERTCSKGYHPAGTIVRGELVDTCGGGVSQFGTTTFNAAFFSGVQLDQWRAHSFYISRYPQGREATLSYPQLDVRFTNTTDGVVVVRTSYTSTSITVSLYGRPVASAVSASHGAPYDYRAPTTEVRTTRDLPEGETRTIQSPGSSGFKVQVVRRVELLDGGTDEQTISTTYLPQNGIVERGTG